MKTRLLIISIAIIASVVIPSLFSLYLDQNHLFKQCIEGRNPDGSCADPSQLSINMPYDHDKYTTVFGEGSILQELGTGSAVLTEDNCHRYAYWATKYQREKLELYEDYPRYPPWGNQIFPLVDYCTTVGDLVKTVDDDKIQWKFQVNEN